MWLLCITVIPFVASLAGLFLPEIVAVPAVTVLIYVLFRKKLDPVETAKANGIAFLALLAVLTVMMALASGETDGSLMNLCRWLVLPFAPLVLVHMIMGGNAVLFATALLTYAAAFAVSALLGKVRIRRTVPLAAVSAVCLVCCGLLYRNRPSVRYAGHGFEYMHGYSSTDFTDYMVYSENSKLVTLDSAASLTIEDEKDMPVLDGAEACYPLYAAFAKAAYRDIDLIEKKWSLEGDKQYFNGKIVTFTNSVYGFMRLLDGADPDEYGDGCDMFFGARPSASQLEDAESRGVELEITPIGREAFVFFVEEDNPVSDLTAEQVRAIYHGDVTNWKELGGKDQEILAFQRPANSGSQTMMEYFMGDVSLREPQKYETVGGMGGVIREVAQYANEKGALGYSFRYFLEGLSQEKGVKMLSIDGVYPSLENIRNGSYPLTVSVCLITRKDDPNPYVRKMIDFILSEQGQEIVEKTGYAGVAG